MSSPNISRRSFLISSTALLGTTPFLASSLMAQDKAAKAPLIAYVGTYTSSLPIIRPGQVDLPEGNGLGIHLFEVDRGTGALSPCAVFEQRTSPSCLALNADGTRLYSANETEKLEQALNRIFPIPKSELERFEKRYPSLCFPCDRNAGADQRLVIVGSCENPN